MKFNIKKVANITVLLMVAASFISCNKFLNVVPDDVATVQKSFNTRAQAKHFLFTCYHYLPKNGWSAVYKQFKISPAFVGSHEFWIPNGSFTVSPNAMRISRAQQKVVSPYLNAWEGKNGAPDLYEGIRKCNVFLKNINKVGNMTQDEKERWIAEVIFLKAYYTFYLTRMYGPIVLYKNNVSVSAQKSKIDIARSPVDSCFSYVIKLLNKVIHTPQLPTRITNRQEKLGRITKSIAYAVKAEVEVTWASPLFNGNKDYVGFKNKKGINPFDTKYNSDRWDSAATASKKAVEFLLAHRFSMYHYRPTILNSDLDDTTIQKMTIRNSVALGENKINPEVVWPQIDRRSLPLRQFYYYFIPRGLNRKNPSNIYAEGCEAPPLKIVELFYTNHGLPINEDSTWDYNERFKVQKVGHKERFNLKEGYKTAKFNFHRGPRFYADLGFDGSIWYGNGIYTGGADNYHYIEAKKGQINSLSTHEGIFYSPTGYWIKKLLNYRSELSDKGDGYAMNYYNWPRIRLEDVYLLYAEAKNEATGPGPDVYKYLNKVRKHAGVPTVQKAWSKWSKDPNQYKTKEGLRKIIHRERSLEFLFEGKRFWDLRRWKELLKEANKPISGWSISQSTAGKYYVPREIANPHFSTKDYFWPISENELITNENLIQNPGWGR